ncbi:hypothetical protein EZV77_26570 [Burkholderia thailandensis]|nr:hypothetical protein A8H32_12550 [Burkholderia thailandensis]MDD1479455.1 hypothetical protein [Burkholderia thailandensis]MDD1485509.1 hypothetical protein [Burkholderia thailandensis]MDD1491326.1 hypothetical protein [Burkholderia thailandensis]PJO74143.1 hypothetical protein CWD92_00020 [Burkholderia thailandensis]
MSGPKPYRNTLVSGIVMGMAHARSRRFDADSRKQKKTAQMAVACDAALQYRGGGGARGTHSTVLAG